MAAVIDTKFPSMIDSMPARSTKDVHHQFKTWILRLWNTVKQPHTLLLVLTLSGVIMGVISGLLLKLWAADVLPDGRKALTQRQLSYVNLLGDLFMRALKMIVLPMVFFTLVNSLAVLDIRMTGRLLATAFAYYLSTMFLATLIGISVAVSINPGSYSPIILDESSSEKDAVGCTGATALDAVLDILRNVVSDNIIQTALNAIQTCPKYIFNKSTIIPYMTYKNMTADMKKLVVEEIEFKKRESLNLNGLVAFSLLLGGILSKLRSEVKPVVEFSLCMEKVVIKMVRLFIWFSPIGVMSLIAAEIVNIDDLGSEFRRLGMYALTVICGLFIHGFVVLPILLLIVGRRNPLKFIAGMSQALFVGFGTSSSNATMPVTLQCIEDNIKIDRRIARFLIPLGIAINMNGTALYEAVAAIYVGQCLGTKFQFGDLMMISISALFAGMGTAAVPQGGLVTLVMVLMAVGLPPKYIILIVPIDWLLGRCRVVVNVFDDSVACAIVHRLNEKNLRKITAETESSDQKTGDNHVNTNL